MKRVRDSAKGSQKSFNGNNILKIVNIILCIALAGQFIQSRLEVSTIKNQLVKCQEEIETQNLILKDLQLLLREDNYYKEWLARKQGFARAEERLFVDVSGIQ